MVRSEAFDNYSLEYDEWFENHEIEYQLELKAIRELLPKEGKGVEIGAGTGRGCKTLGVCVGGVPAKTNRAN
jgi:hypothetical protein